MLVVDEQDRELGSSMQQKHHRGYNMGHCRGHCRKILGVITRGTKRVEDYSLMGSPQGR